MYAIAMARIALSYWDVQTYVSHIGQYMLTHST
jgi:hypothetical protein